MSGHKLILIWHCYQNCHFELQSKKKKCLALLKDTWTGSHFLIYWTATMILMLMSHIGHVYNNVHFQAEKLHRPVHPLSFKLAWLLFMMSISEHMMTPFFKFGFHHWWGDDGHIFKGINSFLNITLPHLKHSVDKSRQWTRPTHRYGCQSPDTVLSGIVIAVATITLLPHL